MRPRALITAIATTVITGAAIALAWPASAATNILTNPDFETGSTSGWTCDSTTAAATGHAHGGTYALAGSPDSSSTAQCKQTVSVAPNTAYTLSAWVNGSYVYLGIDGGTSTWTPGTGGSYNQLSVAFTTTASQTSVTAYVHGWYAQPTYYADDINLLGPGGPGPSPSASRTTSPSPSRTASPSPSVTPTTSPPPTGTLPKHELTGYWQNFTNGATPLRLRDVSADYDLIAVAFANADPSSTGAVTFAVDSGLSAALGGYTDADFIADVRTLHSRGKKVVISVGGEKGNVSVGDSGAAGRFATSVRGLISRFGFDGVDIDLENGLNPDAMGSALRQISSAVGSGLIITMAPQTIDMQSTGGGYFKLALNIKDILTVVHTQFYNSGAMLGCDNNQPYSQGTENFMVALACIQLENGLRPDQVALGLPASGSAAGGGFTAPSVINSAVDCLAAGTNCGSFKPPHTYPALRGVMTWSINWDAANGYNFARTVKGHLRTLP